MGQVGRGAGVSIQIMVKGYEYQVLKLRNGQWAR